VELDFAVWTFAVSEALVVFVAIGIGALLPILVQGWLRWRRRN
jgi:hypothetical protein